MPLLQNPQYPASQPQSARSSYTNIEPGDQIFSLLHPPAGILDLAGNKRFTILSAVSPVTVAKSQGQSFRSSVRFLRTGPKPIAASILWVGDFITTASNYAVIGGLYYDVGFSAPYYSCLLNRRNNGTSDIISLGYNYGGSLGDLQSSVSTYTTGKYIIIATVRSGKQVLYIQKYGGGLEIVSASNVGNITYGAGGSGVILGDNSGGGRDPQCNTALQVLFNRELNRGEVNALLKNPWSVFKPATRKLFTWEPPKTPTTGTATMVFGASAESAIIANATGTSSLTFGTVGTAPKELTYLRLSDGNIYNL